MAGLTVTRSTQRYGFDTIPPDKNFGIKAATKCIQGGIAALDATGWLVPATAVATLVVVGIFGPPGPAGIDNTGGANGALTAPIMSGIFLLDSGTAADLIVQATLGLACYAMDDHTVSPVSTGRSKVGTVYALDPSGMVWVQIVGPV